MVKITCFEGPFAVNIVCGERPFVDIIRGEHIVLYVVNILDGTARCGFLVTVLLAVFVFVYYLLWLSFYSILSSPFFFSSLWSGEGGGRKRNQKGIEMILNIRLCFQGIIVYYYLFYLFFLPESARETGQWYLPVVSLPAVERVRGEAGVRGFCHTCVEVELGVGMCLRAAGSSLPPACVGGACLV